MKSFIYILLTSLTFLVVGCQNESEEIRLINQAERLFDAYPDSVITTLDSILLPEEMSHRLIARWCMLYARAADKIEDEMPYTNQLEIALKYYQKKKMREEEAEIGLYLGRSYVEDKEYEKAMRAYSDALEVALAIKDYNRAGYICSYMGDLYEVDLRYILAAEKYKESGKYFHLANNTTSYVRAFVNEAHSYSIADSSYLALASLKQAEMVMDSLNVEEVRSYVYNGLSNIYNNLGDYDLAEYYILRCIELDPEEIASDYLVLTDISLKCMDMEKAEYYLKKANIFTNNELVLPTIVYYNYKIKKEQGDFEIALSFHEQYVAIEDSLINVGKSVDIYDADQKYERLKLHNENIELVLKNQKSYLFILLLLFAIALLVIFYLMTLRRKNRSLLKQQEEINDLNQNIYHLSIELREKEEQLKLQENSLHLAKEELVSYENIKKEVEDLRHRLINLREIKILNSSLAQKIKRMSQTVWSKASQAVIDEKMWIDIEVLMVEVYPDIVKALRDADLSFSEMHLCFLTLFKLDTKAMSTLLNIIPTSVDKTRLRVRKKLHWEGKQDFYESLIHIQPV
ncbi:putative tetratricopeptide repeat containing protein [Parabacteroides distasonis str. 3776 D15 iv]|uniref:Tetratricopeptide repeat containing protein n=1 Tax=Parabacteroides distasonis str. 3776 D15 i TaxID=1339342 RepID=A0AB34L9G8_PARDI|nr:hypothetical protein [Parabacteroides distasonis]KDS36527.1 putative tetratricopeptide repeat containing protein [Parabacteroides distasonis str. 3776 D15 i]KDS69220.1 putative tetratricopeptide repeat containing protein [Parabacteroides distasonis str. 3776 D15 iv]UVR25030.1 hypothetical protein NXY22_16675 [Parabacteroides distasonis]